MNELKLRYTYKRKTDGHLYQEIVPIECLEGHGSRPIVLDAEYMELWEVIARDLYTGKHDANDNELYENDIVKDILKTISKETNNILTVEFRQSTFCFKEIPNTAFFEAWCKSVEVIGNTHIDKIVRR
jgi:hypothetical protein